MNPSCNLFIIGPTGAGKTVIGRGLAEHYGLPFVDLDQAIESHCGTSIATIFGVEGEAGFRAREAAMLDSLTRRAGIVLATGAGAVLSPVNRDHLARRGYTLWLQASVEHQLLRLKHDARRPLLVNTDRREALQAMAAVREPLYRAAADLAVAGEHAGVAVATRHCVRLVDAHWQRLQVA